MIADAEKEASEVLHSLLSVERIDGQAPRTDSFVVNTASHSREDHTAAGGIQWQRSPDMRLQNEVFMSLQSDS